MKLVRVTLLSKLGGPRQTKSLPRLPREDFSGIGGIRMARKTLSVDLPEELSDNFIKTVTEVGGRWRSQQPEETFTSAIESAVIAALKLFLQGLDGKHELPEFREYARLKYPELGEDTITMIINQIERETG